MKESYVSGLGHKEAAVLVALMSGGAIV